jgi:hypothetical protein
MTGFTEGTELQAVNRVASSSANMGEVRRRLFTFVPCAFLHPLFKMLTGALFAAWGGMVGVHHGAGE